MRYEVECQQCGRMHEAESSHMGRFGEGQIYVVYCTTLADSLADYYTGELVREAAPVAAPEYPLELACHAARTGEGYWTCDVPGMCSDCRALAAELADDHTPDCDLVVYRDGAHTCDCGADR